VTFSLRAQVAKLPAFDRYRLEKLDAIEFLAGLPDASVDCCITDPAYESLEKHRAVGTTTRLKQSDASSNAWFPIFPNERFGELFRELFRVLRKDSHCYVLCDQETMFVAKPLAERAGFKFWKGLVWDKVSIGMGYHYRYQHEMILFFEKGHRNLNDRSIGDILRAERVRTKGAYPTEKPVELLEVLVRQSTREDEIVVDPFFGSGSTGVAAIRNDRRFIGADISEEAHAYANPRLLDESSV
jgi:site-specific DNA-methyltransferase (adenine-specific)